MTKAPKATHGVAANHHYVPKFMLRHFLSVEEKEQVTVFDKKTGVVFSPSIANIMAERRFNDFKLDEKTRVNYEGAMCGVEEQVLPTYERVVANRCLDRSDNERMNLALLMTIQFLRTKGHRDLLLQFDQIITDKTEAMGFKAEDIDGYVRPTEDNIKARHLDSVGRALSEFAGLIAMKDFLLVKAAPGRAYYLADNPVTLHNDQNFGFYGNLGLAVPGIQLYLPLSADLVLCAFCPSIFGKAREAPEQAMHAARAEAFAALTAGRITPEWMRKSVEAAERAIAPQIDMLRHFGDGTAYQSTDSLMDFNNSLQVKYATRFVVCKNGDFELARRFIKDFPNAQGGRIRAG